MKNQKLKLASQSRTEDLRSGLPHETALVSGYSAPELVGAESLFPTVEVSRESGSWTEFGADASAILTGLEQPIGAGRKDISIAIGHGDYKTVKVGLNVRIYDEERDTIEPEDRENFVDRSILRGARGLKLYKEKAICDFMSNSANVPAGSKETHTLATTRWGDYTNSDPTGDVERYCESLEAFHECDKSEFTVNLSPDVFNKVRNHPKCAQITLDGRKIPATEVSLTTLWGVKQVKVFRGKYSVQTDPKDPRTALFYRLWKNLVVINRVIETPTIDAPLPGAIIRVRGTLQVRPSYRDNDKDADVFPFTEKWGLMVRTLNRLFVAYNVVTAP